MSEVLKEPGLVAGLGKGKFQEHTQSLKVRMSTVDGWTETALVCLGSIFMTGRSKTESLFFLVVKWDRVVCSFLGVAVTNYYKLGV